MSNSAKEMHLFECLRPTRDPDFTSSIYSLGQCWNLEFNHCPLTQANVIANLLK